MPRTKTKKTARAAPLRCTACNCQCCCQGRLALYRTDAEGKSVFTGMACPRDGNIDTDTVRLDDTWGDLDGPGHVVFPNEFFSQMSFYADSTLPIKPMVPAGLLSPTEAAQYWPGDDIPPTDESEVRAGDTVRIACMDVLPCGRPARERFWIDVHSVVPVPPTIIGTVVEPLYYLPTPDKPLDDKTLLQVPLGNVLAVRTAA